MSAFDQAVPGHGMTEIESAVMARFDDGQHYETIARALGLQRRRVHSIIQMFQEGRNDAWETGARRGTRELLAALRRVGAQHA